MNTVQNRPTTESFEMPSDIIHWKDIAELVGVAAIVASLVFVGLQMRQAQDIAISEGNLANAANKIEANNLIAAQPDIWSRGTSGATLDDQEAVVFRSMVKNVYEAAHFEFLRTRRLGQIEIAAYVVANHAAFLFNNPGARRLWADELDAEEVWRRRLLPDQDSVSEFDDRIRADLEALDQPANP